MKQSTTYLASALILTLIIEIIFAAPTLLSSTEKKKAKPKKCAVEHTTQKGDSCFQLAGEYGLTKEEFKEMNPNVKCKGGLPAGKKLCFRYSTKLDSEEEEDSLNMLISGQPVDRSEIRHHFMG
ncbi:lysM domain-containing protein [Ditylenchus destructor]|nr:lysM domain-containing protein [Ditylenchus destructor]